MTSKEVILIIIGILAGLGVGYLAWGAAEVAMLPGDTSNNWPLTQCPPAPAPAPDPTAKKRLEDIVKLVDALPQPPPANAQYCKTEAMKKASMVAADQAEADIWSAHAAVAYVKALANDWVACGVELDGIN